MSFIQKTRVCLNNINQNDVCRMFWLGYSPYKKSRSSMNILTSKKSIQPITPLTHTQKSFCTKKRLHNGSNSTDKIRFNIICGGFSILGIVTFGGEWRPGWEFLPIATEVKSK